jgi:hypothetical protein
MIGFRLNANSLKAANRTPRNNWPLQVIITLRKRRFRSLVRQTISLRARLELGITVRNIKNYLFARPLQFVERLNYF